MSVCELKLSIAEVRSSGGDPAILTGIVLKELAILAKHMRMDVPMIWHLVEKVVEKVQEEMKKFSTNPDKPYPPLGKSDMVLYVTMPEVGKLAQGVEWREKVIV